MSRHPHGIVGQWGDLMGHFTVHHLAQGEAHLHQRVGEGMLLHKAEVFFFEPRTEIPSPGSHETALTLIHALEQIIINGGCGAINPFELIHRVGIRSAHLVKVAHFGRKQFHSITSVTFRIQSPCPETTLC